MATDQRGQGMTVNRPARMELPGQVVLVFQGGGALGAYQLGIYQAMDESGIQPDWVVGTSIGAINAALIAGNPPERRYLSTIIGVLESNNQPDALRRACRMARSGQNISTPDNIQPWHSRIFSAQSGCLARSAGPIGRGSCIILLGGPATRNAHLLGRLRLAERRASAPDGRSSERVHGHHVLFRLARPAPER